MEEILVIVGMSLTLLIVLLIAILVLIAIGIYQTIKLNKIKKELKERKEYLQKELEKNEK